MSDFLFRAAFVLTICLQISLAVMATIFSLLIPVTVLAGLAAALYFLVTGEFILQ